MPPRKPGRPKAKPGAPSTEQRLIRAAIDAFSTGGIHATSLDDVAKGARVAKMSVYQHYESKDGLICAALNHLDAEWMDLLAQKLSGPPGTGRRSILDLFDALAAWAESVNFRGCSFIRAAVELRSPGERAGAKLARDHKARFRTQLQSALARDAVSDAQELGEAVALLIDGALVASMMQRSAEPFRVAKAAARRLLA